MTTPSKSFVSFCPYCEAKGHDPYHLIIWLNVSNKQGTPTRWTKCEGCGALWREVYAQSLHKFLHDAHWRPAS